MTDYLILAADLTQKAPAQARLLKEILINPDQTTPELLAKLNLKEARFRQIVGRLRDNGVELIVTRVQTDPVDATQCEYRWSIQSNESVEHWAGGRQSALRTAWERVEKMMIRHLKSIEGLDPWEGGVIEGGLRRIREDLERLDLYAQVKIEEAKAEAAATAAAAAVEAHATEEVAA